MCRWLNWIHTKWHKQGQCVSHCLRLTVYVDTVTLFRFWTIQHKHIRQSLEFQWNREACFLSFPTITVVAETIGLSSKSAAERWDEHLDPTFSEVGSKAKQAGVPTEGFPTNETYRSTSTVSSEAQWTKTSPYEGEGHRVSGVFEKAWSLLG